jgi:hypothetical protein
LRGTDGGAFIAVLIEHHLLPTVGRFPLDRLSPQLIQRLIVDKDCARATQTVCHIHGMLHLALDHAVAMQMRRGLDRIFHKPVEYLGCVRQYSRSNWKLIGHSSLTATGDHN